jgi:outer membrane protein assembly factor BamB
MYRWRFMVVLAILVTHAQVVVAQDVEDSTDGPAEKWRVRLEGARLSAPVYSDGLVYVNANKLVAMDGATGEVRWSAGSDVAKDPVEIWGNKVLGTSFDGEVYAFDRVTGRQVWTYSFWTNCGSMDRPNCALEVRVAGGLAIVKDWNWSEVHALDVETGALIWKATFPEDRAFPALAAGDGRVVIFGSDRNFRALDTQSGDLLWEYAYGSSALNSADIDIIGGRLYAALYDGSSSELIAIDLENGTRIWSSALPDGIWDRSMSISTEEELLLVGATEEVLALHLDSGVEQWHVPILQSFPPVVAGDITFVGTREALIALETATGSEIWRLELEDADGDSFNGAVLGDNGVLYVSSYDHMLYAFDVGAG